MEYPTGLDKYKWFARLFLEGVVTHSDVIAKLADNYLLSPVTMIKPWAKLVLTNNYYYNSSNKYYYINVNCITDDFPPLPPPSTTAQQAGNPG